MIEAEGNGLSGPQFANSGKKLYDDNSTWSKLAWNSCIHRKPLGKAYKDWELKKRLYICIFVTCLERNYEYFRDKEVQSKTAKVYFTLNCPMKHIRNHLQQMNIFQTNRAL
jgi:hypothetical protein